MWTTPVALPNVTVPPTVTVGLFGLQVFPAAALTVAAACAPASAAPGPAIAATTRSVMATLPFTRSTLRQQAHDCHCSDQDDQRPKRLGRQAAPVARAERAADDRAGRDERRRLPVDVGDEGEDDARDEVDE